LSSSANFEAPSIRIYLGIDVINDLKKGEIKSQPHLLNDFYGEVMEFFKNCLCSNSQELILMIPISQKCWFDAKKAFPQKERENTPTLMPLMQLLKRIASDDLENCEKIDDK
jgi:hypothetical protein